MSPTPDDLHGLPNPVSAVHNTLLQGFASVREREELVYALLNSLPRSSLAIIHQSIVPLLQLDIVGLLPDEVALLVYSFLPWQSLLTCSLVSRRWHTLTNDPSLWRRLCSERKWEWRSPPKLHGYPSPSPGLSIDSDDEGMGDDELEEDDVVEQMLQEDSGFSSMIMRPSYLFSTLHSSYLAASSSRQTTQQHYDFPFHSQYLHPYEPWSGSSSSSSRTATTRVRHSAPSVLPSLFPYAPPKPDYKLLFQTHIRLQNRIRTSSYNLSSLQTRGAPNSHTNTIYCLQLYTYPDTGVQVLFTGSKDRTVREWDLATGAVTRVIEGVHESSVLSICVFNGLLATGGSDRRVVIFDLKRNGVVHVIMDHVDSVLCVRFDEKRLVSCSKDRTVRTYLLPDFTRQYVLRDHRAAVNAVSISSEHIVSASGDRSMRLWDAETGALLRTFENYHGRGIASIDFKPPYVLSGSSDKHLRLLDIVTSQGWSTSPEFDTPPSPSEAIAGNVCESCGNPTVGPNTVAGLRTPRRLRAHEDLVRSVALNADFVVSGSYDYTVKVWDRRTGTLVADLSGGHTGRIFCVGADYSKIVSCGEDQRICIWDFSHGIDTSFIKL
ncbi:WD40-repeat-containing domain protein [Abortiporus biennis]|nr:WD40-repeat-containing domain protein [Abortiporus biennis]